MTPAAMGRPRRPVTQRYRRALLATTLAAVTGFGALATDAGAGDEAGFIEFVRRFVDAVDDADAVAVAGMTRLPFLYEGRALGRGEFEAAFSSLFDVSVRRCLASGKFQLEPPDRQVAFCGPYAFYFGVHEGQWKLLEFGADGEPD